MCIKKIGECITRQLVFISRLTEKMTGWDDTWKWLTRLVARWFINLLVGGMILVYVMEKIMHEVKKEKLYNQ
jgi:hypothetical protein